MIDQKHYNFAFLDAVSAIKAVTGYDVEVVSGEEEALYGYYGAMQEFNLSSGVFVDIGGASTEVVCFENSKVLSKASFPIGSLSLYKECVKNIFPGRGSVKRIHKAITAEINKQSKIEIEEKYPLVCVGGTARAVLRIIKKLYNLSEDCQTVTKNQLEKLSNQLQKGEEDIIKLILKLEPERIHTIVPGIMILQHICQLFNSNIIIVSKYGVREGYLCQKIL